MNRMEKPRLVDPNPTPRRSNNDPYGFVGTTLAGRYQIEDLLGIGGMAVVYRAKHLATTRTVAIKILKPDLAYTAPQMVEEFLDEAKATANLNHRNIIEVSDADRDESGTTFLVMQYLKGKPLDDVIDSEQPLAFERIANLFEQICDGVQHAHANGIIHRDLKPGNIMVMADGRGEEAVKILDFGIAKAMTATAKVSREIGTIYYASPEQLSKGSSIDARSDIYSLGVILYQMLTGAVPFNDDSVEHIIYQKLNFAPPLMRQVRAEIPAPVEEVIQRALAKDPANRYQDATEMARAFWRAISLETGALVVDCVDASGRTSLAGASVLINSRYVGQTDVKGHWRQSGMLPRQYLVEIESPRFQHWRASIRVEPREEVTVTVEMQPEPKGDLVIACGVAGVQVELDQKKIGTTDESGRIYVEAVDAGRQHIRLSHPQYLTAEADVEVGITEQAFLQAELKLKNIIWWQQPIILASAAVLLILGGVGIYRAISNGSQQNEPTISIATPTPVFTPIESTPEPLPKTDASATPNDVSAKPGQSPIPKGTATVATPFPAIPSTPFVPPSTPPPSPSPLPETADNGITAYRQGDYQKAINILRRFQKDENARSVLADAYLAFGMSQLNRGQSQSAINNFEEGFKIKPDSNKAVDYYNAVVSKFRDDPNANFKLCQAYFNRGGKNDFDEAVKKCGHAIVNKNDFEAAYSLIDSAYQRLAEDGNKHAIDFYTRQLASNKLQPLPLFYQGLAYLRRKKTKEAKENLKLLQQISSPYADKLNALIPK